MKQTSLSAFLALVGLILTVAVPAAAQPFQTDAELTVRVQEFDQRPIAGASITVLPFKRIFTTDASGEALMALPPGEVSISASADGFYPNQARTVQLAPGHPT